MKIFYWIGSCIVFLLTLSFIIEDMYLDHKKLKSCVSKGLDIEATHGIQPRLTFITYNLCGYNSRVDTSMPSVLRPQY